MRKPRGYFRINPKPVRGDPMFDKELEDIIRSRYGNRIDKRPVGRAVIQRKIIKHNAWKLIKEDLKKFSFLPEKN